MCDTKKGYNLKQIIKEKGKTKKQINKKRIKNHLKILQFCTICNQ